MDKITELLTRGVERIYPSPTALEKMLRSKKKLRVYHGIDPTGSQLHIGHTISLRKLRQFQNLGHTVILLIGDFTAQIGDPTGRLSTRQALTHQQVLENAKNYKQQASKILRFIPPNPVQIRFNSEWLGKLSAQKWIELAALITHQQLIERDMFQTRIHQGKDIFLHELLYPLMQGYDSVMLDTDVEVGGSDQTFNMLIGRKMMKKLNNKEKFVITTPLLTDSTGNKIGKSEGNVIGIAEQPNQQFSKIMALGDDVVITSFILLTDIPLAEIQSIEKAIQSNEMSIMEAKKRLARELVAMYHTKEAAQQAQKEFENVFQKKKAPADVSEIYVGRDNIDIPTVLVEGGVAKSRAEVKRLLAQGAIEIDGSVVNQPQLTLQNKSAILKIGKHRFVKLVV